MPKRSSKKKKEQEINVGGDLKLPLSGVERRMNALCAIGEENRWNVQVIT